MIKRISAVLFLFLSFFIFFISVFFIQTNAQEYGTFQCQHDIAPVCFGIETSCTSYGCTFPSLDPCTDPDFYPNCGSHTFDCDWCPLVNHGPVSIADCAYEPFEFGVYLLNDQRAYSIHLHNVDTNTPYIVHEAVIQHVGSYFNENLYLDIIDGSGNVLCNSSSNSEVPAGTYEVRLYLQEQLGGVWVDTTHYRVSDYNGGVITILPPCNPGGNCCACGWGDSCFPQSSKNFCPGGLAQCVQGTDQICRCNCYSYPTATPGIPRSCTCRVGDTDMCHVDHNGCLDYMAVCDQTGSGFCYDDGCTCQPYPTAEPTIPYAECDSLCPTPPAEYNIGNCLTSEPPSNMCIRPPSDPWHNCDIDNDGSPDSDCWCCRAFVPRPTMDPLGLCGSNSIDTAIGCLPVGDRNAFLAFILRWAIGITAGVSFILIIYSGFMIMASGGDKSKLQSGKELLTAAIAGLMLLIFSVFILDLIGIRILRIPGL